jgi:hypothetical protein
MRLCDFVDAQREQLWYHHHLERYHFEFIF